RGPVKNHPPPRPNPEAITTYTITRRTRDSAASCPCCLAARHHEGARPTPRRLASAVAGWRGWVRSGRPLRRYTGRHARVASNLPVTLSVLGGAVGPGRRAELRAWPRR